METIPIDDRMVIEERIKSRGINADLTDLTRMQLSLYDGLSSVMPNQRKAREVLIKLLDNNINIATSYNRIDSKISS